MAVGDKVLASQYNSWWTSLNNIRTSWDAPGTAITPTTASQGQIASASTINSLINQVNSLASFYSGADWTNFTESTKAVGEPIKWPNKMVYMLDYLSHVCAYNSTFSDDSTFGDDSYDSTFSDDSTFGDDSYNSTFNDYTTNTTEDSGYSEASGDHSFDCPNNGTCNRY